MDCPSHAGALSLGKFLPALANDEHVREAIALENGTASEAILRSALEGREDEVIATGAWDTIGELIANGSTVVEELSGNGPYENTFPINILQFGPVFWVKAQEFDAAGYFATFEDARAYAKWEFAPFMTCADEEDDDGEQGAIEGDEAASGERPPSGGMREASEPKPLISDNELTSKMRPRWRVDDQGRWDIQSPEDAPESPNSSHGISAPLIPWKRLELPIEDESAFWASFPSDAEAFAAQVRFKGVFVTYKAVTTSSLVQPLSCEEQPVLSVRLPTPPGDYYWKESWGGLVGLPISTFRLWRDDFGYFPASE